MPRKRSRMGYRGLSPRERYPQEPWGTGPVCPQCGSKHTMNTEYYAHEALLGVEGWCGDCSHWWAQKINEK
jgi:hypothetical protein